MSKRKTKFSVNQPVAFRFGHRKLIGQVQMIKPLGKKFVYDVLCEDGKVYEELSVDTTTNRCIDTYLTKLFYKKYSMPMEAIPDSSAIKSSISDVYLPESIAQEEPEQEPETDVKDYSVDYDEENPDQD